MAVLLQIKDACKSYGDQVLLDHAEATITDDKKVGFIGRNGAGKSTLLRVILGEEELDAGEVVRHANLKIGYLRQHDPFKPDESAMDFLMRDSGQPDWKCGEVAGQFEIKGDFLHGPVSALSGGWQTRVKLSALLLGEPNVLLLDEPTNFLDLRTQLLLENFLQTFREACLIVSHDRAFLTATCSETLDLTAGKLTMYPGQIDAFLQYQAERREHDLRANQAVIAKQKQLERFINKNRANANTASQARSKKKQLERLQVAEIATDQPTAVIIPPKVQPRQGAAVRCEDLAIGYPGVVIADDIHLEIEHGQRTAIVGDNGQGKTTLLRTLVGSLDAKGGSIRWGHHCDIGVYAQHVYTTLDENDTVLDYLEMKALKGTTNQQILAVAGSLLFRDSHIQKKIKVLSGGERARLCMAGILLGDHNILVLDEPGNHLDVETVEALANALLKFNGTVIFTSHDRHFMKRIASSIIEVRDGTARNYIGDYDSYLYSVSREIDDGARDANAKSVAATQQLKKAGGSSSKAGAGNGDRSDRKTQKQIKAVERKLKRLEEEKSELNDKLLKCADPDAAIDYHNEILLLDRAIKDCEEQWLELTDGQW